MTFSGIRKAIKGICPVGGRPILFLTLCITLCVYLFIYILYNKKNRKAREVAASLAFLTTHTGGWHVDDSSPIANQIRRQVMIEAWRNLRTWQGRRATPRTHGKDWTMWLAAAWKYVKKITQRAPKAAQDRAAMLAVGSARMASLPAPKRAMLTSRNRWMDRGTAKMYASFGY